MFNTILKKSLSLALSMVLALALVIPFAKESHADNHYEKADGSTINLSINYGVEFYSINYYNGTYDTVNLRVAGLKYPGENEVVYLGYDIVIPEGMTLNLSLGGYSIDLRGHHFINYGEFNVFYQLDGYYAGEFYGGKAEQGGFVENYGTLTLNDVSVKDCEATGNGGAIYNGEDGEVIIYGGSFYDNVAGGDGGCIYNLGELEMLPQEKSQYNNGGGFVTVKFKNNTALNGCGGAICNVSEDDLDPEQLKFDENKAKYGGAIYTNNSDMDILYAVFNNNEATEDGGAIYIDTKSSVEFSDSASFDDETQSVFDGNKSGSNGGALFVAGKLSTYCVDIKNNEAGSNGGAVFVDNAGKWTLSDGGSFYSAEQCLITGNTAGKCGGAIYNAGTVDFENDSINTISSNHAGENGGAVWTGNNMILSGDPLVMKENTADGHGGAVSFEAGSLTLYDGEINIQGNTVAGKEDNVYVAELKIIDCDGFTGTVGVNASNSKSKVTIATDYDPDDGLLVSDAEDMKITEKNDEAVLVSNSAIGSMFSQGNILIILAAVVIIAVIAIIFAKKKKSTAE